MVHFGAVGYSSGRPDRYHGDGAVELVGELVVVVAAIVGEVPRGLLHFQQLLSAARYCVKRHVKMGTKAR
eukprot:2916706-Rhodomonas_salina.1